jgi:outer membrane protein assembly factor BamD
MARAYDEMKMTDLRDDVERVMRKNFPESEYLSDSSPLGKTAWWKIW